jgi:tripartite-type tricarboxylate transporter receptor subunit TctC
MQELVDDSKTKRIIEFISAGSAIGRALITPPGVPADRLAVLRAAFDKVVKDPEFIADAARRSADLEPTPGATVQTYSDGIARAPKDIIEAASRAIAAEKDKK